MALPIEKVNELDELVDAFRRERCFRSNRRSGESWYEVETSCVDDLLFFLDDLIDSERHPNG